jgi:putative hydrolase of the HAD superfamily
LGLRTDFSCLVVTDDWGRDRWKPHPIGFEHIMEQLRGPADGYVYIGDNPRKDFIAPRSLGWRTVRIRRDGGEHETYEPADSERAEREIRSLNEVRKFMRNAPAL